MARALARHHALADVASDAERRADAAWEAMQRLPAGAPEREDLRLRWDQLCRIATSLRSAPGYRLTITPATTEAA